MARNKTTAETGYVGFEITNAGEKAINPESTLSGFDTLKNRFINQGIKSATEQSAQFKVADKFVDYEKGIARQVVVVQKQAEKVVQDALTALETQAQLKFDTSTSSGAVPQYVNKLQEEFVRITGERVMKSTQSGHQRDVKKAMTEAMSKYSGGSITFDSENVGKFDFLVSASEWNKYKAEYDEAIKRGVKSPKSIESRIADNAFLSSSKLDSSLVRKERKEDKERQIAQAEAEEQKKEAERAKEEQKQREREQKDEERYNKQVQKAYDRQQLHLVDLIEGYKQKKNLKGESFEDLFNAKVLEERKAGTITGNLSRQDTVAIYQEIEEENTAQIGQANRRKAFGKGALGVAGVAVQGAKKGFSSAKAILGNILKIVALQGLLVNITRRILTSVLDNASQAKANAVEGITLGVTGQQLQYYSVLESTYGLQGGVFKGALQGIQKMFGNITNLDEGAISKLALVMGGDVATLVRSGLGSAHPDKLLEMIMNDYFNRYKQGKNEAGIYVGQTKAREALVGQLQTVSPETAKILERWIEADRVGKWSGKVNTFEDFVNALSRHYMDVGDIETNASARRGEEWDYIKGRWKEIFDDMKKKMSFVFDPIIKWLATTRIGMSAEQKELDIAEAKDKTRTQIAEYEAMQRADKNAIFNKLASNEATAKFANKDYTKLTSEQLSVIYNEDKDLFNAIIHYRVIAKKLQNLNKELQKKDTVYLDMDYDKALVDEQVKREARTALWTAGGSGSILTKEETKDLTDYAGAEKKSGLSTQRVQERALKDKVKETKVKDLNNLMSRWKNDKDVTIPTWTPSKVVEWLEGNEEQKELLEKLKVETGIGSGKEVVEQLLSGELLKGKGTRFANNIVYAYNTELASMDREMYADFGADTIGHLQSKIKEHRSKDSKERLSKIQQTYGKGITAESLQARLNEYKARGLNVKTMENDAKWLKDYESMSKIVDLLPTIIDGMLYGYLSIAKPKNAQGFEKTVAKVKGIKNLKEGNITPASVAKLDFDTAEEVQAFLKNRGITASTSDLQSASTTIKQAKGDTEQNITIYFTDAQGKERRFETTRQLQAGAEENFEVTVKVDEGIQMVNSVGD